jgi:hypothetical protein
MLTIESFIFNINSVFRIEKLSVNGDRHQLLCQMLKNIPLFVSPPWIVFLVYSFFYIVILFLYL